MTLRRTELSLTFPEATVGWDVGKPLDLGTCFVFHASVKDANFRNSLKPLSVLPLPTSELWVSFKAATRIYGSDLLQVGTSTAGELRYCSEPGRGVH